MVFQLEPMIMGYPRVLFPAGFNRVQPSQGSMLSQDILFISEPDAELDSDCLCGVYLMDSFACYSSPGGWSDISKAMASWWRMLGYGIYFAVQEGARVQRGDYHALLEAILYMMTPKSPLFVVAVSMGNDLLHGYQLPIRIRHDPALPFIIAHELHLLRELVPLVPFGMIYGGSGEMWHYSDSIYDTHVSEVMQLVSVTFNYVDNAQELIPLSLHDTLGHITHDSVDVVLRYLISVGYRLLLDNIILRARL